MLQRPHPDLQGRTRECVSCTFTSRLPHTSAFEVHSQARPFREDSWQKPCKLTGQIPTCLLPVWVQYSQEAREGGIRASKTRKRMQCQKPEKRPRAGPFRAGDEDRQPGKEGGSENTSGTPFPWRSENTSWADPRARPPPPGLRARSICAGRVRRGHSQLRLQDPGPDRDRAPPLGG